MQRECTRGEAMLDGNVRLFEGQDDNIIKCGALLK